MVSCHCFITPKQRDIIFYPVNDPYLEFILCTVKVECFDIAVYATNGDPTENAIHHISPHTHTHLGDNHGLFLYYTP